MDCEEILIDDSAFLEKREQQDDDGQMEIGDSGPNFPPQNATTLSLNPESRKIPVPAHRYTPLRNSWADICEPLVVQLKLQIRMNTKTRHVEIRNGPHTTEASALQKAADFVQAFMLGFSLQDAIVLIRMDDVFVDSFEVGDVKMLHGDHMSRAIGRISGKDGKTKFAIENATRTRIVLADKHIHILGSFNDTKAAKNAICNLILGTPPGKVYSQLRQVSSRMNERF